MAVVLRCGEVVHLSTVHRLREVWRDVAGEEAAASADGSAPLELLQAHVFKRRVRGRNVDAQAPATAAADAGSDSSSGDEAASAAEAAAEAQASAAAAAAQRAAMDAAAHTGCCVATAIKHARLRHARELRAAGAPVPSPDADVTFRDLLRVAHPRASESELATIEAAAPPRVNQELRAAARNAERTREAMASMAAQELDTLLQQFDADGSGELDLGEFCLLMKRLGVLQRTEQLNLFEQMDADGGGSISIAEFRIWWLSQEPRT